MEMMSENVPESPTSNSEQSHLDSQEVVPDGLSDAQLVALDMVLSGASDSAVAREVKVDRRTVYRWRVEHPVFSATLAKRRRQLWELGVDRFRELTKLALDRLETQIRDPYVPISMRAARAVVALAQLGKAAGGGELPRQTSAMYCSVELKGKPKGGTTDEHG
jgi:hypothetical protein